MGSTAQSNDVVGEAEGTAELGCDLGGREQGGFVYMFDSR